MLIGNVGRDPNVRYLEGNNPGSQGRKVATFTLATSERFRDRSGETRENTEWHNIVAWGQPADVCERFVRKGTQLYIEGRLRTRKYTDAQGVEKYSSWAAATMRPAATPPTSRAADTRSRVATRSRAAAISRARTAISSLRRAATSRVAMRVPPRPSPRCSPLPQPRYLR